MAEAGGSGVHDHSLLPAEFEDCLEHVKIPSFYMGGRQLDGSVGKRLVQQLKDKNEMNLGKRPHPCF